MILEKITKDSHVFSVGSVGEKFYIILKGSVSIWIRKIKSEDDPEPETMIKIKIIGTNSFFGEMALINNKPRLASIICEEDCVFAVLVKKDFDRILKSFEEKKYLANLTFLHQIPIFETWNITQLRRIHLNIIKYNCRRMEFLFKENESVKDVFILIKGDFMMCKKILIPNLKDENQKIFDSQ